MKNQLLLLADVDNLGRSGDVVSVKPGFARNFLLPQKKAVVADKNTIRLQAKLKEERLKQAAADKQVAEELASRLQDVTLSIEVKVDPEGHMYGSVSNLDIARLLLEKGFEVERRQIALSQSLKQTGVYTIQLKLKEDVSGSFKVNIFAEGQPSEVAAPVAE